MALTFGVDLDTGVKDTKTDTANVLVERGLKLWEKNNKVWETIEPHNHKPLALFPVKGESRLRRVAFVASVWVDNPTG